MWAGKQILAGGPQTRAAEMGVYRKKMCGQENRPWLEDLRQEQQKWGYSVCTVSYNGEHMHML